MKHGYKSKAEAMLTILDAINQGYTVPSQVSFRSRINRPYMLTYIEFMAQKGLIEITSAKQRHRLSLKVRKPNGRVAYALTEEGRMFLKLHRPILELIQEFNDPAAAKENPPLIVRSMRIGG